MERPKRGTHPTCVDPALEILKEFADEHPYLKNEMETMGLEFAFFQMFFWGLGHWQASQEYDSRFRSLSSTCGPQLRQMAEEFSSEGTHLGLRIHSRIHSLQERIITFKRQAKEICILLLGSEIRCKPCQQDEELFLEYGKETGSFIEFLLDNLEALSSKFHLIARVKQQIHFITVKLKAFEKFGDPVPHCTTRVKILGELLSQTQTWANHLSCLACLYWIDHGMDETLASTMGTMLSDLMHKTTPSTPGVVASCFEGSLIPQLLARYFDFLLEELVLLPENDGIEILQERLIFLLSFMMHPPEDSEDNRELILAQIYSMINELSSLSCSIHSNGMKDGISETKLSDFLQNIGEVEAEVRKLYAITPRSAQFNSPRTNAIGFLDSLLQKLEKWLEKEVNFIARVKHGIQTVWEELASLRPFMQHITDIQNEQEELKDLWTRIVDVVYYASSVTKLCTPKSLPIWYGIICLPSVIEEIKVIKNEVMDANDSQMCKSKMPSVEMESRITSPQNSTSKVEGAFIGFKKEKESIIDDLIGGRNDLTIISISGMPGQGKTTLAKSIYNDPKIQYHFHKTVWCYVSKECKIRDLIIGIVHDVRETDVKDISNVEIQDLAERLRKCLKGRRYLVVMDDIWDHGVWCQVHSSFPDDVLGSRILFTSRNQNLKSWDERNFISYPLRLFSEEESWDLMKEKLFRSNDLGSEFVEIGKQIANCCKGLPLAVALVASLLGKTGQNLESWKQVAKNLKSHLDSEGCTHIIELSYKYLPEHLKSCFLYFGAFPRGKNIRAKRLKLLWIAEGFVKGNEMQCSRDLTDECLDYLVSQSLVVVAEKTSMGGIRKCNVHDLIYDLCLGKIAEGNFLHWLDWSTIHDERHSSPQKYGHHRLCIGESDPFMEARPICRRKDLPTSPVESLLCSDRFYAVSFDFLKSFKVLTVLDLEKVYLRDDMFPEVILSNIHLKYLALRGNFKNIPPSIAELWNLETLILGSPKIINRRIPDTLWRLKSLKHVIIDKGCVSLEDFEWNESYVAKLDNNIETLCGLILEIDDQRTMEFLGRMTRLRKLKCYFQGDVLNDAWFSIFGSLENLEELHIGGIRLDSETCSSFPQIKNLRKLSLEDLRVASWSAMSTIGKHLPNIEVLKLDSVECGESRRWDLEDREFSKLRYLKLDSLECGGSRRWDLEYGEFSKLRYLKLSNLHDLEEIHVSVDCDNPFPCLEVLAVHSCRKLKGIPCSFGDIDSLNTIKLSWCSRKASESVMQILEQQRDLGNHSLQVFVTDILARGRYDDDEGAEEEETEAIEEDESEYLSHTMLPPTSTSKFEGAFIGFKEETEAIEEDESEYLSHTMLPRTSTSKFEGAFIGFKEETEAIEENESEYLSHTMLPRTTTSKFEGAFIGFKEETESIIDDRLIGGRKDLTSISISGMPGQGKTTLAKRIYNDPRIQYHFHKTVWCYVSKECKIRGLMIGIVHDIRKPDVEDISKLGIEDLADILRKSLKGKRYLLVMDDIWDDGVWCQVKSSFPDDKLGSRILFTSRNRNLKSQGERNFISYPLRSFSQEESWDLMKEKLNGLGIEFEVIGKEIAKSCKGLPLAVALVASLLGKTEQKLELWNQAAENLKSHLAREGCMHIIELSYKYLPDHLKSCFLYFGAFPRGKNIRAKRLKLLWIAEGFVKENEKQCSKDLADECLDYLVSQSLVVVTEENSMGGIKRCNVHDLIYDLCLEKIVEENFLHWLDWSTIHDEWRSSPQKYGHRRLCIGESDPFMEARPICRRKELSRSPVESLLWSDRRLDMVIGFDFLKSFKVLTVLNLEDVYLRGDVFPEVILCNIHLKYLALYGSFENIPLSIAELCNLETLILARGFRGRVIPNNMWRMKSLRHVIIDGGCVSLEDFEGNEPNVAALDNSIDTLGGLSLEFDDQRTVEFLGRMTNLRKLKCTFKRDALFSLVRSLENLEELKFNSSCNCLVFETCSSFPQNKNLKKLSLEFFTVESWSVLSTIGKQFPNIEVLKLEWGNCQGNSNWDLEDGELSKLRYLKLSELEDLEEIHVSDDCDNPFPCLEVLIVDACPRLKEIPFQIGEIGSLKTIKMSECSPEASKSVMQILEEQRYWGNESLQVFVTDILARGRYDDDEGAEEEETEAIEEDESDDDEETEEVESN